MGREWERNGNELKFFISCDINFPVTFRVEALHGDLPAAHARGGFSVLFLKDLHDCGLDGVGVVPEGVAFIVV